MTIKTSSPKHEKTVPVNARLLALRVIDSVFSNGAYSNIALNKAFSANKISDLDRRFVTELVYGCIKAKGTLDWILEQNVSRSLNKISPVILNILRLGVFQIYFLERIPASAACNEAVNLAKKFGHIGTVKFVNAVLRNCVRNKEKMVYPSLEENKILHLALKLQHPEWLVRRWISDYGLEETEKLCAFNNQAPPLTLRVNTLVITRDELLKKLAEDDFTVRPSEWSKDGIVCDKLPSLELLFKKYNKCFYVQDESSMLVAGILEPKPGQRVIRCRTAAPSSTGAGWCWRATTPPTPSRSPPRRCATSMPRSTSLPPWWRSMAATGGVSASSSRRAATSRACRCAAGSPTRRSRAWCRSAIACPAWT